MRRKARRSGNHAFLVVDERTTESVPSALAGLKNGEDLTVAINGAAQVCFPADERLRAFIVPEKMNEKELYRRMMAAAR